MPAEPLPAEPVPPDPDALETAPHESLASAPRAPMDITLSSAPPLTGRFSTPFTAVPPRPPAASVLENPWDSTTATPPIPPAPLAAQGGLPLPLPDPLWALLARHQLLLPLLRQTVIAKALEAVTLSEEEQQQAKKQWLQQKGIQSPEQLELHLANHGMTEVDALWQAELPLRIRHHSHDHFLHRAEQRFLSRKQQLDSVIYSLLRVRGEALAHELYLRISEGEADFAELAATYAEGPEQATRGVVGPVPLLQAHPILANVLRTSQPGELRPPFAIEQWWLVVRLESLQPASFDDAMQTRMTHELFEEWVEEDVQRLIKEHQPTASP
ncbi:MAG: peptidylprolyl isomerase [Cyanobacteriota bacterium]|nr:peptidylprolyl isomerase [Cyanobacteriota bacterium]